MADILHSVEIEEIRDEFPILAQRVHGKPLVYLDNAATSQKPRAVIEALNNYFTHYNANVHRGVHVLAERATKAYEDARKAVARFLNARSSSEIIFTRGTTEAINLVAYSWARNNLKKGDEILLTYMEHHSNTVPWYQVCEQTGATVRRIELNKDGTLALEHLDTLISDRTKLVAIVHCSNALGTINPVRAIADDAHKKGALLLVDGAQSTPHMPVDVQAFDCDFFALSGHKMCGPTASGVLYGKRALLEAMPPFMGGGEMIKEVHFDRAVYNDVPWKFEAGTPNIAESIGLGEAVRFLEKIGMARIRQHDVELTGYCLEKLQQMPEVNILGPLDAQQRGGLVSFTFGDVHPHDIAQVLDQEGVAIRAGHHCTMPLHRKLGIAASARASFYLYNTREEVDAFIEALKKAKKVFGACPTGRALGY